MRITIGLSVIFLLITATAVALTLTDGSPSMPPDLIDEPCYDTVLGFMVGDAQAEYDADPASLNPCAPPPCQAIPCGPGEIPFNVQGCLVIFDPVTQTMSVDAAMLKTWAGHAGTLAADCGRVGPALDSLGLDTEAAQICAWGARKLQKTADNFAECGGPCGGGN